MKKTNSFLVKMIIILLIILIVVLLMPFFIFHICQYNPKYDFFKVSYDSTTMLNYYASIISFLGTLFLGTISIYQTHIAQQKTDKVNELLIKLEQKNMLLAEKSFNYQMENSRTVPKFEVSHLGNNGQYSNMSITLQNISSVIISNLTSVSFSVIDDKNKELVIKNINPQIVSHSLNIGEKTNINFNNDIIDCNISKIIWKFSCEDEQANIYYYRIERLLPNTSWTIEQIG